MSTPQKTADLSSKVVIDDDSDDRKPYEWKSKWEPDARKEIRMEMWFLFIILGIALSLLFLTWTNLLSNLMCYWRIITVEQCPSFRKYSFYFSSGMLGGIAFGMKYFYRVVARGRWHQDRKAWRIMSPFLAAIIAIVVGTMLDAGLMVVTATKPITSFGIIAIGFLAGYFADEAVGKMYEIANVIFGRSISTKDIHEKK